MRGFLGVCFYEFGSIESTIRTSDRAHASAYAAFRVYAGRGVNFWKNLPHVEGLDAACLPAVNASVGQNIGRGRHTP